MKLGTSLLAPEPPGPTLAQRSLSGYRVPLNYGYTAKCSDTHGSVYTQYAIDVFTGQGTGVYASAAGTVIFADWSGSYGKLLKIHSGSYEHSYGHLLMFLVSKDATVSKSQLVAYTGNTGLGDPHLHFEIRNRSTNHGVDMSAVSGFS